MYFDCNVCILIVVYANPLQKLFYQEQMAPLEEKQLLNLIRYAPVAVVFIFALAVNLIAIKDNQEQAKQSIKNLREELTIQRKYEIRSAVHEVYTNLLHEKSKIESDLKSKAKQRVYEAYGIANHIYAQNRDKSKAEISNLITEALRPIRFDGRGHFFILDNTGTTIMNGENPQLEGVNSWNIKGEDSRFLAREMLQIMKEKGEGFLHWQFRKPGEANHKTFDKVGYIKKFEPYNWAIATGEYQDDFESSIKTKLLKWLSEYEYGENGYFFVLDKKGKLLAHHANDFLGLDFVIGKNIKNDLLEKISKQLQHGGGYIRYAKPLTLSGKTSLDQVSYVREVKDWDWIIGTGFNAKVFEKNLRAKEHLFIESNNQSLMRLIYLTAVSLLLLTLSSLYVGNLIGKRFGLFQNKINSDFEELSNTKDKMEYMALHDAVTDLPNRTLMLKSIQANIEAAKTNNKKLAVMFVDLDNFKNVNDLYGHHIGDLLLGVVSKRFSKLTRTNASVSRFGGDEFVFCFTQLRGKKAAENKAKRILDSLVKPIKIEGKALSIRCSIGVSMYPDDGANAEVLIRHADTVLYKTKTDKKGHVLFYSAHISEQIKRKIDIQDALASAIQNKTLSVHYQPQVRAHDETLVSVEALARWKHPTLGTILPDEFIRIAEESGMIHDLDMLIFKKACQDMMSISANGKKALKLSINISPLQLLETNYCQQLLNVTNSVGINPNRITLEETENIFIHGFDTVQPVLHALRAQGFGLSLDDFGTGYSSLSYINSLPLTEIKIDRTFVNKFTNVYQSDMLVRMIISIGRLCDLTVVAEGVETKAQLKKLLNYDCDLVQGYYFDRPLTIEKLSKKYLSTTAHANRSNTHDA